MTEACITFYVLSKPLAQSVYCTALIYGGHVKGKTGSEMLCHRGLSNFFYQLHQCIDDNLTFFPVELALTERKDGSVLLREPQMLEM